MNFTSRLPTQLSSIFATDLDTCSSLGATDLGHPKGQKSSQLSHEKNPPIFHYTGWLIQILILAYYNPYMTG